MKNVLVRAAVCVLLMVACARLTVAQVVPDPRPGYNRTADTTQLLQLIMPDTLAAAPLDSVYLTWLHTPPAVRDLVADRIGCLETNVPHQFNNLVMSFVTYFTVNNRAYTQRILERENLYFPLFEKYLAKYNLPLDLKYLAVVESALVPQARSRVGAVGLWQFMGPTANDFRLVRNDYIDERMNPEKSTEAACRFLRDLYRMFGNWELALSAYNYGSGNIMRAVRKAGGQRDFWAIYPYLPKETRNYVPTFTAALYTLKYSHEHGLHSDSLHYLYPEPTDTLLISGRSLDLRKLAAQFGLDSAAILRQNPEIRRTYLPETIRNYRLTVPACARQEMAALDRATLLDFCKVALPPPAPLQLRVPFLEGFDSMRTGLAATKRSTGGKPRYRRIQHSVQRGENVAAVAARYDVTPAQLARWNGLRRGKPLAPRRQLVVFVPVQPSAEAAPTMTFHKMPVPARLPLLPLPKEALAVRKTVVRPTTAARDSEDVAAVAPVPVAPAPTARNTKASQETTAAGAPAATSAAVMPAAVDTLPVAYTVRRGDNLPNLARAHEATPAQVISWNKLKSSNVVPGQKLVFYATESEIISSVAEAAEVAAAAPARSVARVAATPTPPSAPLRKTHLVQTGDTLYNISRRYQGVTVEQLRKLNNLKSDEVKPGQKLLVRG